MSDFRPLIERWDQKTQRELDGALATSLMFTEPHFASAIRMHAMRRADAILAEMERRRREG